MEKVMKRIWTLALLTMVSSMAWAEEESSTGSDETQKPPVTVNLNESYTGGKIEVTNYSEPAENGSVTVTILVTPETGYYIRMSDIQVVATVPATTQGTRDEKPEIASALELTAPDGEPADLTAPRSYTFTVAVGLGAWVMEANFHSAFNISGDEESEVVWSYDAESNSITISGKGTTYDFNFGSEGFTDPWAAFRATVTSVAVGEGVTSLGAGMFQGCTALTIITIENSKTVLKLGENAIPANTDEQHIDINVPGNLYNEYLITDGWKDLTIISKEAVEMTGVAFGDYNHYDTYFNREQSLMVPSVLNAFAVSDVKDDGLVLTAVEGAIPAGMAVLVYSKSVKGNDFRSAVKETEALRMANLLEAAGEGGKEVKLGEVYLLYNDVFYFTQAGTIPENGVYMKKPSTEAAKTRSSYPLNGGNGTTGISSLFPGGADGQQVWYSLDGRQYSTMPTTKGIYIKNGRKVVIK